MTGVLFGAVFNKPSNLTSSARNSFESKAGSAVTVQSDNGGEYLATGNTKRRVEKDRAEILQSSPSADSPVVKGLDSLVKQFKRVAQALPGRRNK